MAFAWSQNQIGGSLLKNFTCIYVNVNLRKQVYFTSFYIYIRIKVNEVNLFIEIQTENKALRGKKVSKRQ